MNQAVPPAAARFTRLASLLQQDPHNTLLLADAADAALAAGLPGDARRCAEAGLALEPANGVWHQRLAQILIAERRLPEARALLQSLCEGEREPAVDHDLAYIDLLEGRFADCAARLAPWVAATQPPRPALQALWLRAMHHADRLPEAWHWIQERQQARQLSPQAAGVAALVAVDRGRMDDAAALAGFALQADPGHVEALLAQASVLLGAGRTDEAHAAIERVLQAAPHQPRAWSTLGFVAMAQGDPQAARAHFGQALQRTPGDLGSLHGLGWACALGQDLAGAADAFQRAVAADPTWGESRGSLAVVLALQGDPQRARAETDEARRLQPGCLSARYAEALLTGQAQRLHGMDRLAQQIIGSLGAARRPRR